MPELTADDIAYIKGTSDFFGVNHYSSVMAYRNASVYGIHPVPSLKDDLEISTYQPDVWPTSDSKLLSRSSIQNLPTIKVRISYSVIYVEIRDLKLL